MRHSHRPNPARMNLFLEEFEDGWMEMKMEVAVDVIERQTGSRELVQLRGDFERQLSLSLTRKKINHTGKHRRFPKFATVVHQMRNLSVRESGCPTAQSQMQSHAQFGI